jgi:NADPH oxidase 2
MFSNWFVNDGRAKLIFILYLTSQLGYFGYSYRLLFTDPALATFRSILNHGLPIARGAANVINLNCALILFTVCRNVISTLRGTFLGRIVPFDKNITFHIWIAYSIVFWSVVHIVAHYFNYLAVSKALPITAESLSLMSGPGWTGQIISVAFFLMVTSAMEAVRRKYFEMFWYTHHLFILFFGGLLMHGSFCFIKSDRGDPCRGGPTFWKWWIASGIFYFGERILREYRGRQQTKIYKVVQHPSKVVEIQFKKSSFQGKAGQYIFINCPEISTFQWHPYVFGLM